MDFLTRLGKAVAELDRLSQRHDDEELRALAAELYRQLAEVVNVVERLAQMYRELDHLVRLSLRLDVAAMADVEPPQTAERLADFYERARASGQDPNMALAHLLATGQAALEFRGGEAYIARRGRQRY